MGDITMAGDPGGKLSRIDDLIDNLGPDGKLRAAVVTADGAAMSDDERTDQVIELIKKLFGDAQVGLKAAADRLKEDNAPKPADLRSTGDEIPVEGDKGNTVADDKGPKPDEIPPAKTKTV